MEIFRLVYTEKHCKCSVLPLEQYWNPNALSAPWALFTSPDLSISPLLHLVSFSSGHFSPPGLLKHSAIFLKMFPLPFSASLLFACKTWLELLCGFLTWDSAVMVIYITPSLHFSFYRQALFSILPLLCSISLYPQRLGKCLSKLQNKKIELIPFDIIATFWYCF